MRTRGRILVPSLLAFGFAFLYVPILSMVVYSFNNSRLVTVWDHANSPTLKWYHVLLGNDQVLGAAWLSVKVAALTATLAAVLGTMSGLALVRLGRVRGRALLGALTAAPLVMPEVITGLSLLMLFVAMEKWLGWPAGRGVTTITIAHVTFAMAYVTVIIQARLSGMDESLEEAASDLGARPLTVFRRVTLPMIMPAVVSGWLLAFTLSWDDVVISQFVAGPSSTTLPMVVFSKVRLGVSPDVNALATLMVATVAVGVVGSSLWMRARERRLAREQAQANE